MSEISSIESLAARPVKYNLLHPTAKLLVTLIYLICVISYKGDRLTALFGMIFYPFVIFLITGLSFKKALYRLRIVLPPICLVGIFNPILNHTPALSIGALIISEGMLVMLSLMLKGILCVLASYLLIATTPLDKLCFALRDIHVPRMIVTQFMLIYRYFAVIGREADSMVTSYSLRAPGQKGIAIKSWGPMIGQLLIRSMDKADIIYQSMCLKGFRQEFPIPGGRKFVKTDYLYLLGTTAGIIFLRLVPVIEILGKSII